VQRRSHNQKALEFRNGYENSNGLAARVISDVVEGLKAALSGWQEMQARFTAEGMKVDAEAAQVAATLNRPRNTLA
jgi:hypothetical protein